MREIATDNKDVQQIQSSIQDVEDEIKQVSIGWNGNVVTVIFDNSGSESVQHKLGRVPVGYITIDKDSFIDEYIDKANTDEDIITFINPNPTLIRTMKAVIF